MSVLFDPLVLKGSKLNYKQQKKNYTTFKFNFVFIFIFTFS